MHAKLLDIAVGYLRRRVKQHQEAAFRLQCRQSVNRENLNQTASVQQIRVAPQLHQPVVGQTECNYDLEDPCSFTADSGVTYMAVSRTIFNPQPVTLTGNLVRLEPIAPAHAADLYAAGAEELIWRYAARPALSSVADAEGWIKACLEEAAAGTSVTFAAVHLESGKAVGSTAYIDIVREHRTLEIGMTWYGTAWQRTGVNTECKYLLLRHAFEEQAARRVSLKSDSRNERSRRAILRLGAVEEGTLRNHRIARDGADRHTVYHSVIENEWPAVKRRLEGLMQR